MDTIAFEIMDELYFLTSYSALEKKLNVPKEVLDTRLIDFIEKKWIDVYIKDKLVMDVSSKDKLILENYSFVATKEGMFMHNKP